MTPSQTQLQLRIYADPSLAVQALLLDLANRCRVVVRSRICQRLPQPTALEVELQGPISALQCLLQQLQRYPVRIQGKGHAGGDSWHY